ncbi:MAG: hypothetical protein EOP05_05680 [Proteobacteria bacterium]|nr:MAG: hypothetical protein EOP05_05680 [Pseudomonadota bacterium]
MTPLTGKDQRKFLSVSDLKFQKEFVAMMVFVALSSMLIMVIGTWFMMEKFASLASEILMIGGGIEDAVASESKKIWLLMIGASLVNCLCIGIFAFWFSKRASGIVFRLTKDLNRLADGENVVKIVPREGDFFLPLVDAANRLIEKPKI